MAVKTVITHDGDFDSLDEAVDEIKTILDSAASSGLHPTTISINLEERNDFHMGEYDLIVTKRNVYAMKVTLEND